MKIKLVLFLLISSVNFWAQSIYTEDFGSSGTVALPYVFGTNATGLASKNANVSNNPSWTQSNTSANLAGVVGGSMSATLATATGSNIITCTFNIASGFQLTPTSLTYNYRISNSGAQKLDASIAGTTGTTSNITQVTTTRSGAFVGATTSTFNSPDNYTGAITLIITLTNPTAAGSTVRIDDISINGTITPVCAPPLISTVFPTSGPRGSQVTITASSGSLLGASAKVGGVAATIVSSSAMQLVLKVPATATTGGIEITDGQPCKTTTPFTLIDKVIAGCQGTGGFSDLLITEVYDSNAFNVWHMELLNPTNSPINLGTSIYTLKRYQNIGDTAPTRTIILTGTVAAGATFYMQLGDSGTPCGGTYDLTDSAQGINANDEIRLTKNGVDVDKVECPNEVGYSISRLSTASGPSMTYNAPDWTVLSNETCSNLNSYPFTLSSSPATTQPSLVFNCSANTATISVTGTEGVAGGFGLVYQWYALAPSTTTWTSLTNAGLYSGVTTNTLSITSFALLDGYQFYCQVRENTATCFTPTDAIQILATGVLTSWNGTTWSSGAPTLTTAVIINGTYNTATSGSFDACSVTVYGSKSLTIAANTYVNIQNGLTNNGTVTVQNNGSLVQIADSSTNNSGNIVVERASNLRKYDYVYWSAPITNQTLSTRFSTTIADKIWEWNPTVANPNGSEGNWENAAGAMSICKGYIVRAPIGTDPTTAANVNTIFSGGVANNGTITTNISRGTIQTLTNTGNNSVAYTNLDDNANLVGNPYPSAIRTSDFLTANSNIQGFINIWTHGALPIITTQNQYYNSFLYNYNNNDYITYNGTGTTNGPSGFNGLIASGQGFFVTMNDAATATETISFTNAMRNRNHSNNQFYRSSNANLPNNSTTDFESLEKHRIWLDIVSDDSSSRAVVGYVQDATQGFDRVFDARLTDISSLKLFSVLDNERLLIQGRALPFSNVDAVDLGFVAPTNSHYTIAIAAADGLFANNNQTIYLEDKDLNIIHNLSLAPYNFATSSGLFNNRFVLRYTNNALESTKFDNLENQLIISANASSIKANSSELNIKDYVVYNVLGQIVASGKNIYQKNIEINTIQKNNQVLIVKNRLENGVVVSKKVIF